MRSHCAKNWGNCYSRACWNWELYQCWLILEQHSGMSWWTDPLLECCASEDCLEKYFAILVLQNEWDLIKGGVQMMPGRFALPMSGNVASASAFCAGQAAVLCGRDGVGIAETVASAPNHKKGKALLLPMPVSRKRSGKHRGIWLFCRKAPSSYQKVPFWKRSVVWIIIFFVLKPVNGKWIFVNILRY